MQFNKLKEALQPKVSVDLDAYYTEFVQERGSGDLVAFVTSLYRKDLVSQELLHSLVSEGGLDKDFVGTLAHQMEADAKDSAPAPEEKPPPMNGSSEAAESSEAAAPSESPEAAQDPPSAKASSDPSPEGGDPSPEGGETSEKTGAQRRSSRRKQSAARRSGARSGARSRVKTSGSRTGGRSRTSPKDRLKRTIFGMRHGESSEEDSIEETTDLLRREYTFHGLVGEGAMGRVLRAEDLDLLRIVAYKEMSEEIAATPALASKFYGEAQITAQLDHPNIVPVYQLEQTVDGMLAYTMKLIQGVTLEDLIEECKGQIKNKKMDAKHTLNGRLDVFLRICDAMYYAHSRGVVHRDLKPENVMIGAYGEVYVMDWGISKVVDMEGVDLEKKIRLLTDPEDEGDLVIGTPQYMSPEQAYGENNELDHKSDQYSLGLILFELVTLKHAVTGKSAMKIVMRQQDGEKDSMVHIAGEKIAKELRAIVNKSTAKEKKNRYPNVAEFAEDIRRYQRGEEVMARRDSVLKKIERWIGRHKQITAFVVFMIFSLGALLTLGSWAGIWYMGEVAERERQQLATLMTEAGSKAHYVDAQFLKYEGLLGVITTSASEMLTRTEIEEEKYWNVAEYDRAEVEGMIESERYRYPIHVGEPVFMLSQSADPTMGNYQLKRLVPIRKYLRNVLLRSYSEKAAAFKGLRAKKRIAKRGTPITWAYVGLETGGYVVYPGHGGLPAQFDATERPWYESAAARGNEAREPNWGTPTMDVHGQGQVLSCVQPIYDDGDHLLGVTGIDVTFDYLIDELLPLENMNGIREILLLNGEGREVVSTARRTDPSSYELGVLRNRTIRMDEFDVPEVVSDIKSRRSGNVELTYEGQDTLIIYILLDRMEWYYVIIGNKAEMVK